MKLLFLTVIVVTLIGASAGVSQTPIPLPAGATQKDDIPEPSATTNAKAPEQPYSTYVIGPEDSIQIAVWKEPALSGTMTVRPDGMISLSLIGDIRAAGTTPPGLSANIRLQLQKYITNPTVTVSVVSVNSKRIYFVGEVQHAGPMPITAGMTILQAVSSAGGLTPYANARHIYILRNLQGRQIKVGFDYKKAVKTGDLQGVTLVPGDTIVVP